MLKVPYLDLRMINGNIQEELDAAYDKVTERQWYIGGASGKRFESEFADYCGVSRCVGTGNGLDAIRLILLGLGIGAGDEVIVPAHTFIATVLAVSSVGATPVFADVDIKTYNLDIKQVEAKITEKTRAVIVVHLYGRAVHVEELRPLIQKYGLKLIEDAAQSHGAMINGKKTGSLGDAAAFSFYPGKNLGAFGDAGAVVTNDKELEEYIRACGNYGSCEKYHHVYKGCNSRLDELQAAFLSVKLKYLDEWNRERRKIAEVYCNEITNENVKNPELPQDKREHVFHIYPVLVKDRKKFTDYMIMKGIQTNIHYPISIFEQEAYREYRERVSDYPVTRKICREEVSIPLYPGMTDGQISYVVECINQFQPDKM